MNDVKKNIANNLYNLRIKNKLTQADFAKKLNYTDKSVSKWEKGDATPPIEILCEIAEIFNVSLDYLTRDNDGVVYEDKFSTLKNRPSKLIITLLADSLVWLIATILFTYYFTITNTVRWQLFIYAIPISSIILLIFNCIWGKRIFLFILLSIIVWSTLLSVFIIFLQYTPWATFIVGVPLQLAIILWSQMNKKTY